MLNKLKGLSIKAKVLTGLACVAVITVTAVVIHSNIQHSRMNEKNLYMALRFMEQNNVDMASEYLLDTDEGSNIRQRFVKDTAEIVRQQMKGNETLWKIRLNMLETDYVMDSDQRAIVTYLSQGMGNTYLSYETVLGQMLHYLDIADKRLAAYANEYDIVGTAMSSGYLSLEQKTAYSDLYDETAAQNLALSVALSTNSYGTALQEVVVMVKEEPSEENRILLADIIARAGYAGYSIDESYFMSLLGEEYDAKAQQKSNEKLEKKIKTIEEDITNLEFKMSATVNGEELTAMNEDLKEFKEEKKELENRLEKGLVYKAMNSVQRMRSLESKVVMAKLQYVVEQPEAAMETLLDAADSLQMKVSDNEAIKQGLTVLNNLQNGQSYSSQMASAQAAETLHAMFNATNENIRVNQDGYYGYGLETELSSLVLAEYKYVDSDIYISYVDDSAYPEITLTVNAREEILRDIVKKKNVVVKDTHYEVSYDARIDETITPAICFVVDISGSMDGTPIANAKTALGSFADTLNSGTEIALVSFDSWGYINVPVTTEVSTFAQAAGALYSGGGTDITAGIEKGIEALQDAGGVKNIILMTDGQSSVSDTVIQEALNQDIKIFTVGFGDVDTYVLEEVAKKTGGTFTLAASSGDLAQVYESIGSVIGYTAKVTYTVKENPDETSRYVFIDAKNYQATKKKEYGTGTDDVKTMADGFSLNYNYSYSIQDMQNYGSDTAPLYFDTANSDAVESITLNGVTLNVELQGGSVYTEIAPITQEGLYDITFNFTDGSSYIVEDGLLIYDETIQNQDVYSYGARLGCILIYTSQSYCLSDGTVVFVGAQFTENNSESTLDARTNNFVVLDSFTHSTEYYGDMWYLDYGDAGSFHLDGTITLTSYDAQNVSNSNTIATVGKVVGTIDNQQFAIKEK